MPTTRPGFIWSGSEWVAIGQEAVVAPVSYQTSAPSTPATGDIWIDSDDDVPGIDTSQFLRWRKTAAGGETSLSGTDDNGLTLAYTPNYEQVYLNGVCLVRGQDYTATNGTSITGLTALAASDVVEVFGVVARVVGDVYTQAQSDAKYFTKQTSSTTSGEASTVNINTKPWNLPWGIQSHTKSISNTVTSSTVAGLTTSFTFINNRRYKVSAMVVGQFGSGRVLSNLGVGSIGGNRIFDVSSGGFFNLGGYAIVTGTGTSQSITVGWTVVSGSVALGADNIDTNYHSLTIEDVGPA